MHSFSRRSRPESLVSCLLRGHDQEDSVCLDFLREAVKRFPEDEQFPVVFADAMFAISTKLSELTMEDDYKPYLNVSLPRQSASQVLRLLPPSQRCFYGVFYL